MGSPNNGLPVTSSPFLRRFLRFFFHHFYHGFAWTYDPVAAFVSIGRWNDWVESALPFVQGERILEIGHGPGHLQVCLRRGRTRTVVGLDESHQMGSLAKRQLRKAGHAQLGLTRGLSQFLPFPTRSFDTVVSTFPAEYIFEPQTLQEIHRVLTVQGVFILIPAAWIMGREVLDRAAAWLFRATDQAPAVPAAVLSERLRGGLEEAGFQPEFQTIRVRSSEVLVVIVRL